MCIRILVCAFLVCMGTTHGDAITWSFDEDSAQGWLGLEFSPSSGRRNPLYTHVAQGVWSITPNPPDNYEIRVPMVELLSPAVGADVELFDQLRLRVRLVHDRGSPVMVSVRVEPENVWMDVPAERADKYEQWTPLGGTMIHLRPTEWQELVVARPDTATARGTVRHVRCVIEVGPPYEGVPRMDGPEDVPEALEVDWIRFTGVGEQLEGELPPPPWEEPDRHGELFAQPEFVELRRGMTVRGSPAGAALGDLDGDGDLDLVSRCGKRLLVALNDGAGRFAVVFERDWPGGAGIGGVLAADVVGSDGMAEVLVTQWSGPTTVLRKSDSGMAWEVAALLADRYAMGIGQVDADGQADLLLLDTGQSPYALRWIPAVSGPDFGDSAAPIVPETADHRVGSDLVPLHGRDAIGTWWYPGAEHLLLAGVPWLLVTYLDADGVHREDSLMLRAGEHTGFQLNHVGDVLYVGDLNQDGACDLIATEDFPIVDSQSTFADIRVGLDAGGGYIREYGWRPEALLRARTHLAVADLNADGRPDIVYVDYAKEGSSVSVNLAGAGPLPELEGRYSLQGPGGEPLPGDIDNDGDVDLVLTAPDRYGTGGVYVLRNRLDERNTAITQQAPTPVAHRLALSRNWPNPFNAGTTLTLTAPHRGDVEVAVYSVLGQRIATLHSGFVSAGAHRMYWDGRIQHGGYASSGVYLCRASRAGRTHAVTRVVRVE